MATAYKVLKIDQLTKPGDTGALEHVYRHTIKTKGGTVLTVDIAARDFTPEKTDPLFAKAAENADKILGL